MVLTILDFIEPNGQVAKADGNRIALRNKLDGIDHATTVDGRLRFHSDSVVDAHNFHILLEKDDLVNLLKVVYPLDLAVVGSPVFQILRFRVHHIDLGGIFGVVLNLMFDQIRSQVRELNRFSIYLIRPEEKVK